MQGLLLGGELVQGLVQGLLLSEGLVKRLVSREGWCKRAGLVDQQLGLGLVEWQGLLGARAGVNHLEQRLLLGLLEPVVVTAWCRACLQSADSLVTVCWQPGDILVTGLEDTMLSYIR